MQLLVANITTVLLTATVTATVPKIAIVLATHPPRYNETLNFLSSMVACEQVNMYDVILIFSSHDDSTHFHGKSRRYISGKWIRSFTVNHTGYEAVTYKKLWGVKHAFTDAVGYEYALTLDVDCAFQSNLDHTSYFRKWSERRALFTAMAHRRTHVWQNWYGQITAHSCEVVGLDGSKLGQPVPNLWWNDAPVYEKRGFDAFFSRINWALLSVKIPYMRITPRALPCCHPYGFEHSSYLCYKALVENWEQLPVSDALEDEGSTKQDYWAKKYNYTFFWSRDFNPQRAIVFHVDRKERQVMSGASLSAQRTSSDQTHGRLECGISKTASQQRDLP